MTLEEVVADVRSLDPSVKLKAVVNARKLLSLDQNPPIEALIKCGILPILVACLQSEK